MAARVYRIGDRGVRATAVARTIERPEALIVRASIALVGCGFAEIVLALVTRWLAR